MEIMNVKKKYELGDTVWIAGINSHGNLTKGIVVKKFNIDFRGMFDLSDYYVISIPSHIEDLLEIRTWETISQDENGPVGLFRNLEKFDSTNRIISRSGYTHNSIISIDNDDPSPDEINAALEKSIKDHVHKPLIIRKSRSRSRFKRKVSKNEE